MALFLWNNHEFETKYPESGFRMELGNSYAATAAPVAPDQRIVTLSFRTMRYFQFPDGSIDASTNVPLNFGALENFYLEHKLHKDFDYTHPVYGLISCKFKKPLEIPKVKENEWLMPFTLELIETPTRRTQADWYNDTITIVYLPLP